MKLIFTSIILFFSICFCNAAIVTGLTGFYRHGQVFLTWQNVSNLSTYYKVYRSTSPITSSSQLGTCEYLGYTDSYSSKDISLSAQDSTTKYLRIDSAGIPLPSTTGLFVATTLVNGNYFYAVTTLLSSVEDVTVTVSSNSLTSAITELVNKPMPVYQEYRIISKDTVEIYTTFLSSKYAIDSPLMNNAGFMDFDFAVARNHPDGTLRPIRIRLHGGGALFLEKMAVFTENEINLNVEDKLPSGEKTGFWGLNSNFNIYDDSYNTPWKDGVNYNHTQRRIIDAVDWAIANLQVDTNRIYLESSSMGSPGAYFMGVTYPERFAAINLSAGLFNFAFDSDYQSNCSMNTNKSNRKEGDDRFGKIGTNLPSNLSIGTYQALNGGALIHLDPNRDYPFFYSINGKKDKVMGWTEKTFYYDSVNNNYAGGWYFYDQRQHNGLDGIWDGNNFDMFRYSKAISYPAISNCSLNEDWGDGDGSSGDSYGTVNGSIDWLPPSKDNATNYEIKLFIRDLSKSDGTFKVYADSCTATIVPRRLQGFHVATGATVYWSITHKGNVIQSGSIVKENGIMIFPLIKIYKDSVLFKLTLSVATYYQDNDDDGYGNPSVSIVAALQPIGYVLNANDCNDSNALINPGTNEVCNTVDDNCNGSIDEGLIQFTYYVDSDGDSYGNLSSSISTCSSNVPIGYALSSNDCNDENTAIHPNATEVCNMIDDDCNTLIDENNSIVATITLSGNISACKGEKVIFNASTGSGYAYQWKKDDSNLSGATNSTYTSKGNESGNYTVQINNQNGCSATSPATALTRNPKPTATITALDNLDICSAGTVTLQANSGDGYTYKWFLNAVKISGASNQTYNATLAGSYTVKVKNSYGCAKTSAAVVVTSSCKLNGDEKSNGVLFSVYPNPNNGKFILRIDQSFIGEEVKVEIKNIIGQVVYADHFKWGNENKEITLPDKTISGIYLVELKVADKSYSSLLSVEKK